MRTHALTFVLMITTATLAMPAQVRREPLRGSAEHADRSPWAGATVHMLSRPIPGDERFGDADEVETTADAKGRFTVELLPGRTYLAWAIEELGDDRYRASAPREDVLAGRPLELVADEPRPRRELRFTGLAAWQARGDVVATVMSTTTPRIVVSRRLDGDRWLLPPLPGRGAQLMVTATGAPLLPWAADVDLGVATADPESLGVPREIRVRTTGPDGKPVAGAAVMVRTMDPPTDAREPEGPAGITDAAGEAVIPFRFPDQGDATFHNFPFGVYADGFAPVQNVIRVAIAADYDVAEDGVALALPLEPGIGHRLQLRRGGEPYVTTVRSSTLMMSSGNGPNIHSDTTRLLTTDAEGRLELHRIATQAIALHGLAAPLADATTGVAAPLHPVALLGFIARDEQAAAPTLDLDALVVRRIEVTLDGVPQPGAHVALVREGDPRQVVLGGMRTDRNGRTAALVPPDLDCAAVAFGDRGYAVAQVNTDDAAPIRLALAPIRTLAGKVVDAAGKPMPFATVECYVRSEGDLEERLLAEAVSVWRVPTDRDGAFALPLLPGLRYHLGTVRTPHGDHYLDQEWIAGRDDPETLRLDLGKAR